MKYAIWDYKGQEVWARILKVNKNGTVRVQISQNWRETITPKNIVSNSYIQKHYIDKNLSGVCNEKV